MGSMACKCELAEEDGYLDLPTHQLMAEDPAASDLEPLYPMWLVPMASFLKMQGPPVHHQALLREGVLVPWRAQLVAIFVSHQWLSICHPDPRGEQLEELRLALQGILAGAVAVESDAFTEVILAAPKSLGDQERRHLAQAHIWYDFFGVPQPAPGPEAWEQVEEAKERAIHSIPAYISRCAFFVALCPEAVHEDTGDLCSYQSWLRRGWCRLELLSHALVGKDGDGSLLLVRSATQVKYVSPLDWLSKPVGAGAFTREGDREHLRTVAQEILGSALASCSLLSPLGLLRFRFLQAVAHVLLMGPVPLGGHSANHAAPEPAACAEARFLKKYRFSSFLDKGFAGFGALHCAAAAGDVPSIRAAVRAGVPVDATLTESVQACFLLKGTAPLRLAVQHGGLAAVTCLVELGADVRLRLPAGLGSIHIASSPALAAGQPEIPRYLLENMADANDKDLRAGLTPLVAAACTDRPDLVDLLVSYGADVNMPGTLGLQPLHLAPVFNGGHEKVVDALMRHGAKVNAQCVPSGSLAPLVAISCLALALGSQRQVFALLGETAGATPLIVAAMLGRADLCKALLGHHANPAICNARGRTALELARHYNHQHVAALLQQEAARIKVQL